MKCKKCGLTIPVNRIRKNFYTINGGNYCLKCAEKCHTCKKIMIKGDGSSKKYHGDFYCRKCYSEIPAETCCGCRVKIEGGYYVILNRVFCMKCHDSEQCPVCGSPIGRNIAYLPDRIKICFNCTKPPMIDTEKAQEYLRGVAEDVHSFSGIRFPETEIKLVTYTELQKACDWITLEAAGLCINGREILIVPYYPENYFKTVLCHEAVHAWQHANWKQNYNMDMQEGMARYIELLYTIYKGFSEQEQSLYRRMELKPGSHYTIGLQKFLEMEKEKGRDYVFNYFKSL